MLKKKMFIVIGSEMVNVIVPLTMADIDASCHSYIETQKSVEFTSEDLLRCIVTILEILTFSAEMNLLTNQRMMCKYLL